MSSSYPPNFCAEVWWITLVDARARSLTALGAVVRDPADRELPTAKSGTSHGTAFSAISNARFSEVLEDARADRRPAEHDRRAQAEHRDQVERDRRQPDERQRS